MTPDEVAQYLHARRAGRNKWMARCPAHGDRSPSLSIRAGRDGRTVIHCFAGCSPEAIVAEVGLTMACLFGASVATPSQVNQAAREHTRRMAEAEDRRRERGQLIDQVRRLSKIADALGEKLARAAENAPGADSLTKLFHATLERLREIEEEVEVLNHADHR